MMKSPLRLFLILLTVVGFVCLVAGVVVYEKDKTPSSYVSTTGTIAEVQPIYHPASTCHGNDCVSNPAYYSYNGIINFSVKGSTYTFSSNYGSPPFQGQAPKTGETVDIDYNPSNPSNKPIDTSNQRNKDLGQLLLIVGAGIVVVFGLLLLFTKTKKTT
jgi:hypothetical protein